MRYQQLRELPGRPISGPINTDVDVTDQMDWVDVNSAQSGRLQSAVKRSYKMDPMK